jgi:hypothetical protein
LFDAKCKVNSVKRANQNARNNRAHTNLILCVNRAKPLLLGWEQCRRLYIWAMTAHQKSILRWHSGALFGVGASASSPDLASKAHSLSKSSASAPELKSTSASSYDLKRIFSAATMNELDEHYSRRRAGFDTVDDYYHWVSSANYMHTVRFDWLRSNCCQINVNNNENNNSERVFELRTRVCCRSTFPSFC